MMHCRCSITLKSLQWNLPRMVTLGPTKSGCSRVATWLKRPFWDLDPGCYNANTVTIIDRFHCNASFLSNCHTCLANVWNSKQRRWSVNTFFQTDCPNIIKVYLLAARTYKFKKTKEFHVNGVLSGYGGDMMSFIRGSVWRRVKTKVLHYWWVSTPCGCGHLHVWCFCEGAPVWKVVAGSTHCHVLVSATYHLNLNIQCSRTVIG